MKKIEQVAIFCKNEEVVKDFMKNLSELGVNEFIQDRVKVKNLLDPEAPVDDALLTFNYQLGGFEFELITYEDGKNNFISKREGSSTPHSGLSHLGVHVDSIEDEIHSGNYPFTISQYVETIHHENAGLKGKRFKYLIFSSETMLGFDLKLIERIEPDGSN